MSDGVNSVVLHPELIDNEPYKLDVDSVKKYLNVFMKVLRGVSAVLPGAGGVFAQKVVAFLDTVVGEQWFLDLVVAVLGLFDKKPEEAKEMMKAAFAAVPK